MDRLRLAVEWFEQVNESVWDQLSDHEKKKIFTTAKLIEIDNMRAINMLTIIDKNFDFEEYINELNNK